MDLRMFQNTAPGELVAIAGQDGVRSWWHKAFVPHPLPVEEPTLSPGTYRMVANARAALAALDSTARQLPNPRLLRMPTLRREAQSTSALEGTYAPLNEVLVADEDNPTSAELVEIINYVHTANHAFGWVADGRPLTTTFLCELQGMLMRGTRLEAVSGRLRDIQVVIGRRPDADPGETAVRQATFVPAPPGDELEHGIHTLVTWLERDHHQRIDPVVAAAMSHYQFEALHPFRDGNGRIGRLLIVLHLVRTGVLLEPTLTVSPWFEARRSAYYERLLAVSTHGQWDTFVGFFAEGLHEAAARTREEMLALVAAQSELHDVVTASSLRSGNAQALVDFAVANPSFSVGAVKNRLGISYGRANKLVGQLCDLGVLAVVNADAYKRRFYAPRVLDVLTSRTRV